MRRILPLLSALAVLLAAGASSPATDGSRVDLLLVIAVDVSGSVDRQEATLQRGGYADALINPMLLKAIQNGRNGKIAVTYLEWAGWGLFRTTVDWTVIQDEQSARQFIAQVNAASIVSGQGTSISGAIDIGMSLFPISPYQADRRVIDVSGDGPNNSGLSVVAYRDMAVNQGVTINGLPILNDTNGANGGVTDLDVYYRECVIGGSGSFVIAAENFQTFATAILRKLILEVAGLGPTDNWEPYGVPKVTKVQYFGAPQQNGGNGTGPLRYYPNCDIANRGRPGVFPAPF